MAHIPLFFFIKNSGGAQVKTWQQEKLPDESEKRIVSSLPLALTDSEVHVFQNEQDDTSSKEEIGA